MNIRKALPSILCAICLSLCLGACAPSSTDSSVPADEGTSSADAVASESAATDESAATSANTTDESAATTDNASAAPDAAAASASGDTGTDASESATTATLANGDYEIETKTDSSMFHPIACTLHVQDGTYSATITMPGEGFSRWYFGTSEEAANASDDEIYDYTLDAEGKYTFDVPVAALDEDLTVAAWGQRRDRWYDHTIRFISS